MSKLCFTLKNYRDGVINGSFVSPVPFLRHTKVDRSLYRKLADERKTNKNDMSMAFEQLQRRMKLPYFREVYALQSRTLDYASTAFPAYRFILPEVIAEDWLAAVDWHKFHRDHVLHQPLTAYIVLKLLEGENDSDSLHLASGSLLDTCVEQIITFRETEYIKDFLLACGLPSDSVWLTPNPLRRSLWKMLFLEVAYTSAIFHDLGYPWQYIGRLNTTLDYATSSPLTKDGTADSIVEDYRHRLFYIAMNGYKVREYGAPATWQKQLIEQTRVALAQTHGLPGALGFLYLNDLIRHFPDERPHPICQLCVEWTAMAIMMHDMSNVYWGSKGEKHAPERPHLRVRAHVDPLSALITLADTLQEFSRPVSNFNPNLPCGNVGLTYAAACSESSIEVSSENVTITYKMRDSALARKRIDLAKDYRNIFHRNYGYLDLSGWGIKHVRLIAEHE